MIETPDELGRWEMSLQEVEPAGQEAPGTRDGHEPESGTAEKARGRPAHDVFVSYSSINKPVADAIVSRLEQEGVRCWFAPRDVIPGQNFAEAILEAIESSRLMVVVLSNQSNQSQHVPREVERAVHHNVVVVPFRIESVEPSGAMAYFLASEHWLDALTPPLDKHIGDLVQVINNLLERTPPHPLGQTPAPVPPRRRWLRLPQGRRRWLVIGAVVVLLGSAGGAFAVLQGGSGKAAPPLPIIQPGPVPNGAVASFTGTQEARTTDFTVSSPWKLAWTVSSSYDIGPLIEIDTSTGEFVDTIDTNTSGSGSQVETLGGTLHMTIKVYGATNYALTVSNGK